MKILAIDDSSTMLTILGRMLTDLGYINIATVTAAEEAWNLVSIQPFSLILSDWHMRTFSGLDLLRRARGSEANGRTPFLLITSDHDMDSVKQAVKAGVSGYLFKPVEREILRKKLLELSTAYKFMPPL